MAEERTVIISVDIDADEANKQLAINNERLRDNKEEIKELSKEYDLNAKEINELNQENKKLSASNRVLSKEADTQSNSLNALRLQLAKQVKDRNNLNTSTKKGREEFLALNKSIKGLNEEISGFEQAGGDFRRNVGDYPRLLGEAAGGIRIFGTSLGDVFKVIAANPFLLLIGLITSLIAVFAKSQTGIEFFRKASAALNIVLAKLSDIVEFLGGALIEAFSAPEETLNNLVETIREGVLKFFNEFIPNAITKVIDGFGLLAKAAKQLFELDLKGALETATEGTILLVDGLTDLNPATALIKAAFDAAIPAIREFGAEVNAAAGASINLETQLIANEKAQADLAVRNAQAKKELKELNLVIEDLTASEEERLAAADEATKIELDLLNERLRLQGELVQIISDQNDLANSTEEDIQRRRDAQIEFFNIEAESLERSVTLQNKRNTILNAQAAKEEARRKKDIADQKKKDAEDKKRQDKKDKEVIAAADLRRSLGEQAVSDTIGFLGKTIVGERTAALAQIAISSGKGVAKAIEAGAGIPFPGNLAAIASGIGAVLAGIAQASSLLGAAGATSASVGASVSSVPTIDASQSAGLSLSLGSAALQNESSREATESAISNLPIPIVFVDDINLGQADRVDVVNQSTL